MLLRIQDFEHDKETLDDYATKVYEFEAKLKPSEEQIHSLEDNVSEQGDRLVKKDASSSPYWEHVVIIEKDLAGLSAEVSGLTTQHTVDSDLLEVTKRLMLFKEQPLSSVVWRIPRTVKSS